MTNETVAGTTNGVDWEIGVDCLKELTQIVLEQGFELSGSPAAKASNALKTRDWFKGDTNDG